MIILGIETSCDETAAAICEDGRKTLAAAVHSQADMHALYGGVVPELASRRHIESVVQLCESALGDAGLTRADIDAIAVTNAPGLIGALLVGVSFAKSAAAALDIPLIPVHHIRAHVAALYLAYPELTPPFACLAASGGNTLFLDVIDYTHMTVLGQTKDDAAGEAFDKCARVLGLPYPGGAHIDRLAKEGNTSRFALPRPHAGENPLDVSFSGLKTAVVNLVNHMEQKNEAIPREDIAASLNDAVSDILCPRLIEAARVSGRDKIAITGGVAANSHIRDSLKELAEKSGLKLYMTPPRLCGDNAEMVAAQGYYEYLSGARADASLNAYARMEP